MKIGKLEPNLYFSNKKVGYVFFNKPIYKIKILATCIKEFQPIKKSFTKPIKQILCQRIKKEKKYDIFKNVWFGE